MATTDGEIQDLLRRWRAAMASARPRWSAVDLTFTQLRALSVVGRRQSLRVSDLAAELGVGLGAASALVERMARHALVARREDPNDRRSVLLELTPRARRLLDRMERGTTDHFGRLIRRMTPAERDALATTLRAFVRLSAEYSPSKGPRGLVVVPREETRC